MNCTGSGRERFWLHSHYFRTLYTGCDKNHACAVFDVAAVLLTVKILWKLTPCRPVEQFKCVAKTCVAFCHGWPEQNRKVSVSFTCLALKMEVLISVETPLSLPVDKVLTCQWAERSTSHSLEWDTFQKLQEYEWTYRQTKDNSDEWRPQTPRYVSLCCKKLNLSLFASWRQGRIKLFGAPRQWKLFRPYNGLITLVNKI